MPYAEWIIPATIILGALIIGFVLERIILVKLRKHAKKTEWQGDDIIIKGVRGWIVLWFVLAGAYAAVFRIPGLEPHLGLSRDIIAALSILLATIAATRIAVGFIRAFSGDGNGTSSILTNIARVIAYSIGLLLILQVAGVSVTPLLTALGVGGLAIALALQETLSNLFSGIHVVASKKVKPGDYIKLDSGEEGFVEDITWRNATIRQLGNNMVILPNAKLASAAITNYSLPDKELSVPIPVGVSYASDLDAVERITIETAKQVMNTVPGGKKDHEPVVRYSGFGESSIDMKIFLRAEEYASQSLLRHEFIKALHKRYQEEGIDIPFPTRTLVNKCEGRRR